MVFGGGKNTTSLKAQLLKECTLDATLEYLCKLYFRQRKKNTRGIGGGGCKYTKAL